MSRVVGVFENTHYHEPLVLPAIQETLGQRGIAACLFNEKTGVGIESCDGINGPKTHPTPITADQITKRWTCADKTRILEHDEQNPPKYWCRKVVLRGTPESESK